MRSPKEVEKEEYNKFYKSAFKGEFMDPMAYTHFITEVGGGGGMGDGGTRMSELREAPPKA